MDNTTYQKERRCVYELLCSVSEQAIMDYLYAKLALYKLVTGDARLLKSLKRIKKSVEVYKDEKLSVVDECKDLFMRGDYKGLYGNKAGTLVIEALDERFNNEVIPTYDETGNWTYKTFFIKEN